MARAPDPLQERRDPARRADLTDEIHCADVDAELQRRGRDERGEIARAQPLLHAQPPLARQAPVVGGDPLGAEPLAQAVRDPLREAPRVGEHERRAVGADLVAEDVEEVVPLLGRREISSTMSVRAVLSSGRPRGEVSIR